MEAVMVYRVLIILLMFFTIAVVHADSFGPVKTEKKKHYWKNRENILEKKKIAYQMRKNNTFCSQNCKCDK